MQTPPQTPAVALSPAEGTDSFTGTAANEYENSFQADTAGLPTPQVLKIIAKNVRGL